MSEHDKWQEYQIGGIYGQSGYWNQSPENRARGDESEILESERY